MSQTNVDNKESKRRVAHHTPYDGDNWEKESNQYTEVVRGEVHRPASLEFNITSDNKKNFQNVVDTFVKPDQAGNRESGAPVKHGEKSKQGDSEKHSIPVKHEPIDTKVSSTVQSNSPVSYKVDISEDEDADNGSIQDIFGFYENRQSQHPYSIMVNGFNSNVNVNDYSDSTASLSTGIRSVESGFHHETKSSMEYQSELDKVPEVSKEIKAENCSVPVEEHLDINRSLADMSLESNKTGNESLSKKTYSDITSAESNKKNHATTGSTLETTGVSYETRPYSQVVDDDIAELYHGSSEFLNRPISTYQGIKTRDISDKSIRDILTPHLEQKSFAIPQDSSGAHIPALLITSASPEGAVSSKQLDEKLAGIYEKPNGTIENDQPDQTEHNIDLRQNDGENCDFNDPISSSATTASAKEDHQQDIGTKKPILLSNEHVFMQQTPSSSNIDSTIIHGEKSKADTSSDETTKENHARGSSDVSSGSQITNFTIGSANNSVHSSRESRSNDTTSYKPSGDNDIVGGPANQFVAASFVSQVPQTVASKVKRPPQVDFLALFQSTGNTSELKVEQMHYLRTREIEYSTGLETWLMATMENIDESMKIYTNGIPPTSDIHSLEGTASSKMSNVMHSSATNTKEKLGKVGTKSKSFFAKVIR